MAVATTIDEGEGAEVRVQFCDTLGRPLAADSITAATVTLFDVESGDIINNRDGSSIVGGVVDDLVITATTKASPCVVTAADHGLQTGDKVHLDDIVGMTELNGRVFEVERLSDDTFALVDCDSRAFTTYSSGGVARVGLLVWVMSAADNAIVGSQRSPGWVQRHRAEITITYGGGKTARTTVDLLVRNTQAG